MQDPDNAHSLYLMPGEFFWGGKNSIVTTVLGSCISICLWHPGKKIGGICHYRLPGRREKKRYPLNPHYGDDAMWLILEKITLHRTETKDYIVKVFGGAEMFTYQKKSEKKSIGEQNIDSAIARLKEYGFSINLKHVHGNNSRKIVFNIATGAIHLYHGVEKSKNKDFDIL